MLNNDKYIIYLDNINITDDIIELSIVPDEIIPNFGMCIKLRPEPGHCEIEYKNGKTKRYSLDRIWYYEEMEK